jgi:hypothetical protein
MRVSVPAEDGSQQLAIFTHVHQEPVPKYRTHAYSIYKQEIRHKQ